MYGLPMLYRLVVRDIPSTTRNALVMHVISESCDTDPHSVLVKVPSHVFQRVNGCGDPFSGSGRLQVWRTGYEWSRNDPMAIAVTTGNRTDTAPIFAVPVHERLRIDHHHILAGVVDLRGGSIAFHSPAEYSTILALLHDRQGCEGLRHLGSCGRTWKQASLFTLLPAESSE